MDGVTSDACGGRRGGPLDGVVGDTCGGEGGGGGGSMDGATGGACWGGGGGSMDGVFGGTCGGEGGGWGVSMDGTTTDASGSRERGIIMASWLIDGAAGDTFGREWGDVGQFVEGLGVGESWCKGPRASSL